MAVVANPKKGGGTFSLGAWDKSAVLFKNEIQRPKPGPKDVQVDIKYCGMCHSDLHSCNGDWGIDSWPMVPGHEVAGIVKAVGDEVKSFKVGDEVGVGCFVKSCGACDECKQGLEQHCMKAHQTYSTPWAGGDIGHDECKGNSTLGGYSTEIVVDEHFVFHVPKGLDLKVVGPLLCAGITTYSPLARHVLGKQGLKVGVVGFGGLGQMAVKLAKAMGAEVTVFSRSNKKEAEAAKLGAKLQAHSDKDGMKKLSRTLDYIMDTVSAKHDISHIISCLKVGKTYSLIGGIPDPIPDVSSFLMIFNRYNIEGSLVGGCPETNDMLKFCHKHNVLPETKLIHAKEANDVFKALAAGTNGIVRNVIDVSTIKELPDKE